MSNQTALSDDEFFGSPATPASGGLTGDDVVALENTAGASRRSGIPVHQVVSHAGAVGLNQIMPNTARQYGFDPARLTEPEYNNKARDAILADLNSRYNNDPEAAAIAYNAGPGRANHWLANGRNDAVLPAETRGYVSRLRQRATPQAAPQTEMSDADFFAPPKTAALTDAQFFGEKPPAPVDDDHPGFWGTLEHGATRGMESIAKTAGALFDPDYNPKTLRTAPQTFLDQPLDINKDDLATFAEKGLSQLASGWPTMALAAPTGGASLLTEMGAFGLGTAAQSYGENVGQDPKTAAERTALQAGAGSLMAPIMRIPFGGGKPGQFLGQVAAQTAGQAAGDIATNEVMGTPMSSKDVAQNLPQYAVGALFPSAIGAAFHTSERTEIKPGGPTPISDAMAAVEKEVGLKPGAVAPPAEGVRDSAQANVADKADAVSPENEKRDASPNRPTIVRTTADLDKATARVHPENTAAEIGAQRGTYGHMDWKPDDAHAFDLAIENASGGVRRGNDENGKPYESKMPADYGYFKGTKGKDGKPLDAFMGPMVNSGKVYVINTKDPKTGRFDEHKFMLGMPDELTAQHIFDASYSDGSGMARIRSIVPVDLDQLDGIIRKAKIEPLTKPIEEKGVQLPGRPMKPMSIVAQVRKFGGLKSLDNGDTDTLRQSWGLINDKNGLPAQHMAEKLQQEGYLTDTGDIFDPRDRTGADVEEMINKLHDEVHGNNPHYSLKDAQIKERWDAYQNAKAAARMAKPGLNIDLPKPVHGPLPGWDDEPKRTVAENEALRDRQLALGNKKYAERIQKDIDAAKEVPFAAPRGWETAGDRPPIDAKLRSFINSEIRRMAPGVKVTNENVRAGAQGFYDPARGLLAYSVNNPDAYGVARHEVLHAIWGALTDRERTVLLREAPKWFKDHDIEARYPGLTGDKLAEEAIAERFRNWRQNQNSVEAPGPVRAIFQKLGALLDRIAAKARQVFGRDPTPDDIFGAIQRGDVGNRPQSSGGDTRYSQDKPLPQTSDDNTGDTRKAPNSLQILQALSQKYPGRMARIKALAEQLAEFQKRTWNADVDYNDIKDVADVLMHEIGGLKTDDEIKYAVAAIPKATRQSMIGDFIDRYVPEYVRNIGRDLQTMTVPMAVRSRLPEMHDVVEHVRATVKKYMGGQRMIDYDAAQDIDMLAKFEKKSPGANERMHDALARESEAVVAAKRTGDPDLLANYTKPKNGLSSLSKEERDIVLDIVRKQEQAWNAARASGMVNGDFIPYYAARKFYELSETGNASLNKPHMRSASGKDIDQKIAPSPFIPGREHDTEAASEAAAQAATNNPNLKIIRDLRTNIISRAELQRAIAIRQAVNQIKALAAATGQELQTQTINHPAFWESTIRMAMGTNKEPVAIFDSKPIQIPVDFIPMLRVMLKERGGPLAQALSDLKARGMSAIMYSPLTHNGVTWGKALSSMPGKVATFIVYRDGKRVLANPDEVREALFHGLALIGHRGAFQDIDSILSMRPVEPGRSITSKLLAAIPGFFDPKMGIAVKKGVDNFGDFWHSTLLWDQVRKLQLGLYANWRDQLIKKGVDRAVACRYAATFANQMAGSIPMEAMSHAARRTANMIFFSRSFTLGNLSMFKTAISGLPRDIQAQNIIDIGRYNADKINTMARRKAQLTLATEMAFYYVGNSLLQSAINTMGGKGTVGTVGGAGLGGYLGGLMGGPWGGAIGAITGGIAGAQGTQQWWNGDRTFQQEGQSYLARLDHELKRFDDNPWALLDPFQDFRSVTNLSATANHELRGRGRVLVGKEEDNTALYGRMYPGKVGEEMVSWPTAPWEMFKRKMAPFIKPLVELMQNNDGFGNPILDPNPKSTQDYFNNIGRGFGHFIVAQGPYDSLRSLGQITGFNKATGLSNAPTTNADWYKTVGQMAGMTFSKGAPGGPEQGMLFEQKAHDKFMRDQIMPQAKDLIRAGDVGRAKQMMTSAHVAPSLQTWIIKTARNPAAYLNPKAMRQFQQSIRNDPDAQFQFQQIMGDQ